MGEIVTFASNGGTASGYLATPEGGGGLPVVVIQEWWGLVPHIEDVCERRGWTQSAVLFNALGTSWSDLDSAARSHVASRPAVQSSRRKP